MRHKIEISLIVLVLISTVAFAFLTAKPSPADKPTSVATQAARIQRSLSNEHTTGLAPGRYTNYSQDALMTGGYNTHILFFYANWCPECQGFDESLVTNAIPDGVQILRIDYDQARDLRQKYGITIQTTFVRVDSSGVEQHKWVGYGHTKSVKAILENVGAM